METTTDADLRYVYCRGWNWKLWEAGQVITEDEARRRFVSDNEDDWFSVVAFRADDPEQEIPTFVLELMPHATTIRAKFYAPTRSQRVEYVFDRYDDRMFFYFATTWFYPDDGSQYRLDQSILIESFHFKTDGIAEQTINDKSDPKIHKVSYRGIDMSDHWEPVPEFGDWARFGNEQR